MQHIRYHGNIFEQRLFQHRPFPFHVHPLLSEMRPAVPETLNVIHHFVPQKPGAFAGSPLYRDDRNMSLAPYRHQEWANASSETTLSLCVCPQSTIEGARQN